LSFGVLFPPFHSLSFPLFELSRFFEGFWSFPPPVSSDNHGLHHSCHPAVVCVLFSRAPRSAILIGFSDPFLDRVLCFSPPSPGFFVCADGIRFALVSPTWSDRDVVLFADFQYRLFLFASGEVPKFSEFPLRSFFDPPDPCPLPSLGGLSPLL